MGFTKLDSGIVDSSIWAESYATRVVWITFLAKANRNGFVAASHSGMQRASNVTPKEFDLGVKMLEAPDIDSRSKEYEGRRIEKVAGGWLILNYQKYREFSYSDSKSAIKKRKQREKKRGDKGGTRRDMSTLGGGHSASASASAFSSSSLDLEEIRILWNGFAVTHGLASIEGIEKGTTRFAHLMARARNRKFDFRRLLEIIEDSPFLLGQISSKGKPPFFVTFDWLICPSNYQKVIEGNYLDRRYNGIAAWLKEAEEKERADKS